MEVALEISNLCKAYGEHLAVDDLNLVANSGEIYALLGPNGAGKTTTLRIVAGLLRPDRGDAAIWGRSIRRQPRQAKKTVAFLPDEPLLYGKLRPLEYLEFVAGLWSVPGAIAQDRSRDLLQQLDLWEARGELCEALSRGMKQKLALAAGFIHQPKLLILDEPLTGLDATAARLVKDLLLDYVARGNTVILTTHIMEIAERLSHRIGIINQGKLVAEGTLAQLQAIAAGGTTLEEIFIALTRTQQAVARGEREARSPI